MLKKMFVSNNQSLASFKAAPDHSSYFIHPCILYGAFQLMTAHLAQLSLKDKILYLPVGIAAISGYRPQVKPKNVVINTNKPQLTESKQSVDINIVDENNNSIIVVKDFYYQGISPAVLLKSIQETDLNSLEDVELSPAMLSAYDTVQTLLQKLINNEYDSKFFPEICFLIIVWATRILKIFDKI